jgi:hypothetical protein
MCSKIGSLFRWVCLSVFAGPFLISGACADESPFGYVIGADTMPKGKWEMEGWFTGRLAAWPISI